jgi:hypothetical protein
MKIINALLDFLIVTYVLLTVFLVTDVVNESKILNFDSGNEVLILYKVIIAIGGFIMFAKLLISKLYIADFKHDKYRAGLKIDELKADLYDKRQEFRNNSSKDLAKTEDVEVSILKQA